MENHDRGRDWIKNAIIGPWIKKRTFRLFGFFDAKKQSAEKNTKKFRFDWEGGLSHLKKEFTSVELVHNSLRVWDDVNS